MNNCSSSAAECTRLAVLCMHFVAEEGPRSESFCSVVAEKAKTFTGSSTVE